MKMLRRNPPAPNPAPPPEPAQAAGAVTRRRVEVTVEREWARETVGPTASLPPSFEATCDTCGRRVVMITPSAAARIAGVTVRMIYRWVDEQKIHFLESPVGDLYLCAQSVPAPHHPQQLMSGDPR